MSHSFFIENIRGAAPELSGARAREIAENLLTGIQLTLRTRGELRLTGVGTLQVIRQEARRGRHPRSGAIVDLPQRNVIRFKPSEVLSEVVNAAHPAGRSKKG